MEESAAPLARRASGVGRFAESVESRASWGAAAATLAILSIAYGAPLLAVVGLKPIETALGTDRSVVALAASLAWLGTGIGGILAGWVADRVGVRKTVIFGAVMTAVGLALSATGQTWALLVGHGLFIGLLGAGAFYPPLVIYVSRWFDRRRGFAVALISSGQYVAGVFWPSAFERGFADFGWQMTMLCFAGLAVLTVVPLAFLLQPLPAASRPQPQPRRHGPRERVMGLSPNTVQMLLCGASFLCCVPMAMPSGHLVALCTDIGIPPATGAAMLSVLLGCAFLSRQAWGWVADRIGGLRAVLAASACQAVAISAFLMTQNEAGLFAVSAGFGLGFSGIIPAYVVAIRELFPSSEASWRVPTMLFTGMSGMAFGGWLAGALYDRFGFYAPAFGTGALFNLANLIVVGFLVAQQSRRAARAQTSRGLAGRPEEARS